MPPRVPSGMPGMYMYCCAAWLPEYTVLCRRAFGIAQRLDADLPRGRKVLLEERQA